MKKKSQVQKLHELLMDNKWHNTVEILESVYGIEHSGIARVGARVHDLKNLGYEIESRCTKKKGIWEYRLINEEV
jgi:hypothetical protein